MSQKIQKLADESGKEIMTSEIWDIFDKEFMQPKEGYSYLDHKSSTNGSTHNLSIKMLLNNNEVQMDGIGNGPIDSFINALASQNIKLKVSDYNQSAISSGSDAKAAAYIELESNGKSSWGVGINSNTTRASFEAIVVGLSKILNQN